MIKIAGQAERSFTFPADLEVAFAFFNDMPRLIGYLPHITLLEHNVEEQHLRVQYSTTELGTYQINIVSDLVYQLDPLNYTILIEAVDRLPAIKPETSMSSTLARGYFNCVSRFLPGRDKQNGLQTTLIQYELTIQAKLPTPSGLRFMPGRVVSGIASGITNGRVKEIADGFVNRSIRAYEVQMNQGV